MKRYLLLTATVVPAAELASTLAVADPDRRRREYETALSGYLARLRGCVDGVVLAENSVADLQSFRALVPTGLPTEFLSVPARPAPAGTGRGYLETMLVADAFTRSELLSAPGAVAVKATGRYLTVNLPAVVRSMDLAHDLGFNARRYPSPWVDMWVSFANARGIAALAARADALVEGTAAVPAERSLWGVLDALEAEGIRIQRRFRAEPRLTGIRAWDGRDYASPRQRAKWLARTVAKRVAPAVWI